MPARRRDLTTGQHRAIADAVRLGCTAKSVAWVFGVDPSTVTRIAKLADVSRRPGHPSSKDYAPQPDAPRAPMYVWACGREWKV